MLQFVEIVYFSCKLCHNCHFLNSLFIILLLSHKILFLKLSQLSEVLRYMYAHR